MDIEEDGERGRERQIKTDRDPKRSEATKDLTRHKDGDFFCVLQWSYLYHLVRPSVQMLF